MAAVCMFGTRPLLRRIVPFDSPAVVDSLERACAWYGCEGGAGCTGKRGKYGEAKGGKCGEGTRGKCGEGMRGTSGWMPTGGAVPSTGSSTTTPLAPVPGGSVMSCRQGEQGLDVRFAAV
jgi:hypothetical protein